MPEGPELFLASVFINSVSNDKLFGGHVIKSEVSTKNPEVNWDYDLYRISAVARGKELKLTLLEGDEDRKTGNTQDILFRFGMSGSFKFTPVSELPKHAHLRFFTTRENPPMVLSFVDHRRFGRWQVGGDWSPDRGPDPMWEYQCFRENVLSNLKSAAFNRPICETLLNQKFFNGIGNYLRAEILYRCGVRPFDQARAVLSDLKPFSQWYEAKLKQRGNSKYKPENCSLQEKQEVTVQPDILDFCHIVPKEVINLGGGGKGYNVDPDADEEEYAAFKAWLRCYNQDEMTNLIDHNKRTIWFSGDPGKLVPKDCSSRSKVERNKAEKNKCMNETSEAKKKLKIVIKKENMDGRKKETVKSTKRKVPKQKLEKHENKNLYPKSSASLHKESGRNEMQVTKKSVNKTKASVTTASRGSSRRRSVEPN